MNPRYAAFLALSLLSVLFLVPAGDAGMAASGKISEPKRKLLPASSSKKPIAVLRVPKEAGSRALDIPATQAWVSTEHIESPTGAASGTTPLRVEGTRNVPRR